MGDGIRSEAGGHNAGSDHVLNSPAIQLVPRRDVCLMAADMCPTWAQVVGLPWQQAQSQARSAPALPAQHCQLVGA